MWLYIWDIAHINYIKTTLSLSQSLHGIRVNPKTLVFSKKPSSQTQKPKPFFASSPPTFASSKNQKICLVDQDPLMFPCVVKPLPPPSATIKPKIPLVIVTIKVVCVHMFVKFVYASKAISHRVHRSKKSKIQDGRKGERRA